MSSILTIIGKGRLADAVAEALSPQYELQRLPELEVPLPAGTKFFLVLDDFWNPKNHQHAERVSREFKIDWMRVFLSFGEGIVGPWVQPDREGCSQCADSRKILAADDRSDLWRIQQSLKQNEENINDEWLSESLLMQMVQLILNEVQKVWKGESSLLEDHIYKVSMKTLACSRHYILPEATCSVCSHLPEDSAEAAVISLQPSLKVSKNSYRCRSMTDLRSALSKDYLDPNTGMFNSRMSDLQTSFADVIVNLPLFNGNEGTAGRTNCYASSEMTAMLEGLERSCGIDPKGKKTVVYDCYRNLDCALHPLDVGVHSKEQYAKPDFPFTAFDPDKKMNWVWGYSLQKEEPILVPERLAYYSMGCGDGIMFETSNGCALGGSLEEAIFHGIMEVLERDSFLMTWYARLSLPPIDPYSSHDEELHLMIDRMREEAGYDLFLYNATMEHGIPSVVTITKKRDPQSEGLHLICAAGAHLDPVRAVKSAIFESVGMIRPLNKEFEKNRSDYLKMLDHSSLVKKMDDHGMLYGLQEAEERLHFLLRQNRPMQSFDEGFPSSASNPDLTEDLRNILQVLRELSLDVIVIDQTTPEISRNGLHCVKVLIPGMLPMTFGHHLTRVTGLNRVLTVPKRLGYTKRDLKIDELNPFPHPFP
ncbi:TOMM precursor leader peptide-binding protein [Halobacillus massiliensis]|uniref:TOMM precursor leader peptide-binding protein n=1 Tax=Halobacillus massiliensis TaxID=1926286 RepID=UPI0009E3DD99|nr:TOMM precursor leader peptide-binding protein [Halobacillus massiliensis]